MQSVLGHHAVQHHRLDCHGLPPCVGTGDHDSPDVISDLKLQRNRKLLLHQRVSGLNQMNPALYIDGGLCCVHVQAQLSLGKHIIQLFDHSQIL